MDDNLQESSERVVEANKYRSLADYAIYRFHVATYEWASTFCKNQHVVDYGCGTGYGPAILGRVARRVDAFDVSPEATSYASAHYGADNVSYQTIDGLLPLESASADVVVSFQVIEHVDPDPYLEEVRRVIRPGGVALFATPNRDQRLFPWQKPWNRWHLTEYSPESFTKLLEPYFSSVDLFEVTASPHLMAAQRARWRRAKLATMPVTLPFIPDFIRRPVLATLSRLDATTDEAQISDPGGDVVVTPFAGEGSDILAFARV